METAKVDIRKLQMLNDRIAQTIEALNQVRLSVHGISHTTGAFNPAYNTNINPLLNPFTAQTSYNPVYGSPFGVNTGFNPGFSHTTGALGVNPYAAQMLAQQALAAQQQAAIAAQNPVGQIWGNTNVNPFFASQGLGHTTGSVNPLVNELSERSYDPYWTQRVSQTFPFIQWGYSPFATQMF